MRTTTKWTIAALAVVALTGIGVAAAQASGTDADRGERQAPSPFWEVCDPDITVAECKEQLDAEREDRREERYQQCVEEHGQESCDEKRAEREERHADGRPPPPDGRQGRLRR